MSSAETRIIHLHIPKTAGTAIRKAFSQPNAGRRVFPHYEERKYRDVVADEYDLFSGHIGFDMATRLGGNIVSVFRNPFDRFVSVYYFWRQLNESGTDTTRKTQLAIKYSLEQFALITDEPLLLTELHNHVTWQVAGGSSLRHKHEKRAAGATEDDIFALASSNLTKFCVIGLQDRIKDFRLGLKHKLGVDVDIGSVNVTKSRRPLADVTMATRRRIYDWVYMDQALFERADALSFRP